MKRIRSNFHPLHALKSASPRLRKTIIENSDKDLALGIVDLEINVLNGNCKNSKRGVDQLRKHKIVLRRLTNRGIALRKKRKLIGQRGRFLLTLLIAALSALPSLTRLKKMFAENVVLSLEYCERLRRHDDEDDIDTEARN